MRKEKTEDGNRTGPPGGTEKVKGGKEENMNVKMTSSNAIYRVCGGGQPGGRFIASRCVHGGSGMTTPQ